MDGTHTIERAYHVTSRVPLRSTPSSSTSASTLRQPACRTWCLGYEASNRAGVGGVSSGR
jgi:hypothetical protein